MKKVYYLLKMVAKSPLRIGADSNEETDSDLLVDGRGVPFIPGSSLAGALRSIESNVEMEKELFGYIKKATEEDDSSEAVESRILINDAILYGSESKDNFYISSRDGVGLDEWGMAIKGSKYDFQIVETESPFYSLVEANYENDAQKDAFENILALLTSRGIKLGARTTRGYGNFEVSIVKKQFDFPQDIDLWIDFKPYEIESFKNADSFDREAPNGNITRIDIEFHIVGNFITRVKEANAYVKLDGTNPDEVTLRNFCEKPVIPGTAWAGSFRHHLRDLLVETGITSVDSERVDRIFGKGTTAKDNTKSIISFEESIIQGGKPVVMVRNAVDRFTAAPINGALFVNESWHGGKSKLSLSYQSNNLSSMEKQLLAMVIMDLHNGILPIGGNVSVGKGVLCIDKIFVNSTEYTEQLKQLKLSF